MSAVPRLVFSCTYEGANISDMYLSIQYFLVGCALEKADRGLVVNSNEAAPLHCFQLLARFPGVKMISTFLRL